MAVYLGDQGFVELRRDSLNNPLTGNLLAADVSTRFKRFSFEFDANALITGDQIEITRLDKNTDGSSKDLVLVSGSYGESCRYFAHVDNVGGIRLYDTFDAALNGKESSALSLVTPTETQQISVQTKNSLARCVAGMTSYELTTSRNTVDVTTLGEEFQRNYANGLISGQGSLDCLWDYKPNECDNECSVEFSHYLAQLVIRTEQGADFDGYFYLSGRQDEKYVWYEAKCLITNVAVSVTPSTLIRTRVQFVTTGEIRLSIGVPPAYVLQEDTGLILLETSNEGGALLEEAD